MDGTIEFQLREDPLGGFFGPLPFIMFNYSHQDLSIYGVKLYFEFPGSWPLSGSNIHDHFLTIMQKYHNKS